MLKIKQEHHLKNFAKELDSDLSEIPTERLCEPPLHLLGPALEASKYYYENEDLRRMFSQLIASSCDFKKLPFVQPSFVEVLKQLSMVDAQVLTLFRKEDTITVSTSLTINDQEPIPSDPQPISKSYVEVIYPIVEMHLKDNQGYTLLQNDVFVETDIEDMATVASAIGNLTRLGLITVDYTKKLSEDQYNKFYNHPFYKDTQKKYIVGQDDPIPNGVSLSFVNIRGHICMGNSFEQIELRKGLTRLTQYGYDFSKVCIVSDGIKPIVHASSVN